MSSKTALVSALCLAASLAIACGSEDDSAGGGGGTSGHSGSAGKAGATGSAGKSGAGGGTAGGGMPGSGTGGTGGEGGEAGTGTECTPFAPFVHGLIKDSTTAKAVPTSVNGIVFCEDPQDPAAFSDLF